MADMAQEVILVPVKEEDATGGEENVAEQEIPPWTEQITVRGLVVSLVLGVVFCVITHKLNLTVGVIPSLNVAAGLLGFFFLKSWTTALTKLGIMTKPFTRQENTVIQTCVVACYGIACSGGFGSYMLAMNKRTYDLIGPDYPGNNISDVKNPGLGWMTVFVFTCSFVGILALVPLRKVMVIDYKLTYPSGTATAVLINSFHTSTGAAIARKQVISLGKFFAGSFFWSFFKWFFSGSGNSCGFERFPSLGLKAFANTFYFDFNVTYIGVGMICPYIVSASVLLGAIISWGIMWPLISTKAGDWFPTGLGTSDFKGLYGYKVFIAIALILGDGLYNLLKILFTTSRAIFSQHEARQKLLIADADASEPFLEHNSLEKKLNEVFMKEGVPFWVAAAGYVILSIVSMLVIPRIFSPVKWYYVLLCYVVAPAFGFCNAYGAGLTDWNLSSTYGKLGLFIFAAWAGENGGGVIAGLATCGVMMSIVSTASDLMQDFKTGYLTLSSPRSMFVSQLAGTAMGCIVAPLTFWMFWKAFSIGLPEGEYKAPYAVIFREMAILGVEGLSALPKHCLEFCLAFFIFAVVLNFVKDMVPQKVAAFLPVPMAMAIPFYIGAYFAIDVFVGAVILFVWEKMNKVEAEIYGPAVASGLICGDGVWTIPSAVLALLKVDPPICMTFLPTKAAVGG